MAGIKHGYSYINCDFTVLDKINFSKDGITPNMVRIEVQDQFGQCHRYTNKEKYGTRIFGLNEN